MYTRGQLSLIGNIGRKAIRLYEDEGLITSSKIDEQNGYHYYNNEQLERIVRIKKYKNLGLSLSEIKRIMCKGITEGEVIREKKIELDDHIEAMKALRHKLDSVEKPGTSGLMHEITQTSFCECTYLYIEENIDLDQLGRSIGKLYEKAEIDKLQISGSHFVKYEGIFSSNGAFKMKTCLPILQSHTSIEGVSIEGVGIASVEKEKRCIYTHFTEGFSRVADAHIQIQEYLEQNRVFCSGTVYEVYNRDMSVDIYYEVDA